MIREAMPPDFDPKDESHNLLDGGQRSSDSKLPKITWAQFHKGLRNIEESMLLNLDLSRPLVATTKVYH